MDLTPDQIKQMISMLQQMLPSDNTEEAQAEPNATIKTKSVKINTQRPHNKFVDMPEMDMHKEDKQIDAKLAIHPPVPRNRSNPLVSAICRVCGKKDMVNRAIIGDIERYKCNKCSISAG